MIGLIAHTCLEATVRFGAELGYEVTVVKMRRPTIPMRDARRLEINMPNYATAILSSEEAPPGHLHVDRLTVNCLRAPRRTPVPRRRQLN